ncbi:response regulator transcription factor [Halobacillus shinanisalinarum]|uniref:Heme response regulator HssR n=1 Tax=Halobacillus shinanisalinarum TaxID=2932258 RepID=A0ABY4H5Q1_9BACI|nr:response regulator transcription factor [Halobacillus shinanisalinarum]UOQ95430.1 response regulator transcription factor [Halobacillus shinanisalinarum]
MITILVVDDDAHLRKLVRVHLEQNGYVVIETPDGSTASTTLEKHPVDLAIVDLMMPNKDGFQLSKEIREEYDIPIIILTAKDSLVDKAKGNKAGTDDYMIKPFEEDELLFRVQAILRRFDRVNSQVIQLNETKINKRSYEVKNGSNITILPLKEFELLYQLASFPNRTFSREQLIEKIWGLEFTGDDRTVDVHIKRLRERFKTSDDFAIKTVRGIGYRLEDS